MSGNVTQIFTHTAMFRFGQLLEYLLIGGPEPVLTHRDEIPVRWVSQYVAVRTETFQRPERKTRFARLQELDMGRPRTVR